MIERKSRLRLSARDDSLLLDLFNSGGGLIL